MKKYLILALLCTTIAAAKAQTITADTTIYTAVQKNAYFTGGIEKLYAYLSQNIHYPQKARENKIQGKVFLTFVIEKDGSISNIRVLRHVDPEIDAEAVRVIKASPKWNPASQNNVIVREQYTLPVNFSLTAKQN